jgi:hypothetical protein
MHNILWVLRFIGKDGVKNKAEFGLGKGLFDRVFSGFYHRKAGLGFSLVQRKI